MHFLANNEILKLSVDWKRNLEKSSYSTIHWSRWRGLSLKPTFIFFLTRIVDIISSDPACTGTGQNLIDCFDYELEKKHMFRKNKLSGVFIFYFKRLCCYFTYYIWSPEFLVWSCCLILVFVACFLVLFCACFLPLNYEYRKYNNMNNLWKIHNHIW